MPSQGPDGRRTSGRRAIGVLVSGTVTAQLIQFVASLLLTRLYTPVEFGGFATALALATVLGAVASLSYASAIPLAATDRQASDLVWLSIVLGVVISGLASALIGGLVYWDFRLFGLPDGWLQVWFIPATGLALAAWTALQRWLARTGGYGSISSGTLAGASVQVVAQILGGIRDLGPAGLAGGYLVGRVANVALLFGKAGLRPRPRILDLWRLAGKWREMPQWLLLPVVMNLLGTSAITPWVAHLFGLTVAGFFAFAMVILSVPAALLGQAVSTVLLPTLARTDRSSGVSANEIERYVVGLSLVAFPVFLPVLVLGPEIFGIAFSSEWALAGEIAAILTPWIALNFVSSPVSSLAVVKGRYRRISLVALVEATSRFGAIGLGGVIGSPTVGFLLYSAVGVTISLVSIGWMLRLANGSLLHLLRAHSVALLGAVGAVLVLLLLREAVPTWLLMLVTCIVAIASSAPAIRISRR